MRRQRNPMWWYTAGTAAAIISCAPRWCIAQDPCPGDVLRPAELRAADEYGAAVAMADDVLIVGAPRDDDGGTNSGAAYIYQRDGATWTLQQKLAAPQPAANDFFGDAVATDGETIIIGAPIRAADARTPFAGAAYVFHRVGDTWTFSTELRADAPAAGDEFGRAVAIDGGSIIVGCAMRDRRQREAMTPNTGAAYHFKHLDGEWLLHAVLIAPAEALGPDLRFGSSVAISGETALIGAPRADLAGDDAGAAFVFTDTGAEGWTLAATLQPLSIATGDAFGSSVALHEDAALVGAPMDDDNGSQSGTAFIFTTSGGRWDETATLAAADGLPGDRFGETVALRSNAVVVGAPRHDASGTDSGAAYVYQHAGGAWREAAKLLPPPGSAHNGFGTAAGLAGTHTVAGVPGDDHAGEDAGAAHLFAGLAFVDCDGDGDDDTCAILSGAAADADGNGVPDGCDCVRGGGPACGCRADLAGDDGEVSVADLLAALSAWGACADADVCPADLDGDGAVNVGDLLIILSGWGACG